MGFVPQHLGDITNVIVPIEPLFRLIPWCASWCLWG